MTTKEKTIEQLKERIADLESEKAIAQLELKVRELESEVLRLRSQPCPYSHYHYHWTIPVQPSYPVYPTWPSYWHVTSGQTTAIGNATAQMPQLLAQN